jgi:hypothetical protein
MSLKLEERLERGASLLECSHSFVFNSEGNSKILADLELEFRKLNCVTLIIHLTVVVEQWYLTERLKRGS